jgi:hypothetical protein
MDDIIKHVIMEDEIARRDFECWEAQRQEQQEREQRQAAHEAEQFAVRQWLAERTEERNWNEWARKIARIEAIKLDNDLVADLEKLIDAFEKQIAHLRKEIVDLRAAIGTAGEKGSNVVPMLSLKGGRDAA